MKLGVCYAMQHYHSYSLGIIFNPTSNQRAYETKKPSQAHITDEQFTFRQVLNHLGVPEFCR